MVDLILQLEVFGIKPLAVLLLIIIMAAIREKGLDEYLKKIKKNVLKWLILTGVSLIVSIIILIFLEWGLDGIKVIIKDIFITWIVGWVGNDILKKLLKGFEK